MVTRVGMQSNFVDSMIALLELEYDALEAYKAAINRVKEQYIKNILEDNKLDHENHIQKLSKFLANYITDIPNAPTAKQWLTKGKVVLGNLLGDKRIVEAMISNEIDTENAYSNVCQRQDKWLEIEQFLNDGFADERRHKAVLEEVFKRMD